MVASISITPVVHKEAYRLASYHGFRSFSGLVESLLIEWLNEKSPEFRKVGDKEVNEDE